MKRVVKILSVVILFFVVCTSQLAAQKCKFDYNKKDHITDEQSKGITFVISAGSMFYTIERPMQWKLELHRVGNKYSVSMFATFGGNVRNIVTPENTIIFKLTSGELITIHANDNYPPDAHINPNSNNIVSIYNTKYDISVEDLRKIAASPLIYLKMEIGGNSYDYEFNAKKGEDFQNKATCILQ